MYVLYYYRSAFFANMGTRLILYIRIPLGTKSGLEGQSAYRCVIGFRLSYVHVWTPRYTNEIKPATLSLCPHLDDWTSDNRIVPPKIRSKPCRVQYIRAASRQGGRRLPKSHSAGGGFHVFGIGWDVRSTWAWAIRWPVVPRHLQTSNEGLREVVGNLHLNPLKLHACSDLP